MKQTFVKLLGAAFVAAPITLQAAELPRFDIDHNCSEWTAMNFGSPVPENEHIRATNACIRAQQEAYDIVKNEWIELDEKAQTACLDGTGRTGSYQAMKYCVDGAYGQEMERRDMERRRNLPPQTFRY